MDTTDQKELYRLWVEYLKRSDDYREFCEWVRVRKDGVEIPEKYKFTKELGSHPFLGVYLRFFDVHMCPFDQWWNWWRKRRAKAEGSRKPGPADDYMTGWRSLEKDIDSCIRSFERTYGREPSARELKDVFTQQLQSEAHRALYLRVDLTHSSKNIKQRFNEIMGSNDVREKLSQGKIWRECFINHNTKPVGKPRPDELQKYLDVYDMWQEKVKNRKPGDPGGWDTIIRHFEPGPIGDKDHIKRVFMRYRQIAEKIIRNVEQGHFPGPY